MSSASVKAKRGNPGPALSAEVIDFIDHVAEILAEEFVAAMKAEGEKEDASSGICEVLER